MPHKIYELLLSPFNSYAFLIRWFKLEGGELRYYGEPSMRPSSLKQSLSLTGCTLHAEDTKGRHIVINLSDGNQLCMEAASKDLASEWVKVLSETMDILNNKSAAGNTRRINVANEHSHVADSDIKQV